MLLAALVLTAAAWMRGAEYDEQYTLFLTAGVPRPDWPRTVFPAGMVATVQAGHATLTGIARDLRATDVHPPLYFWGAALWRPVFGPGLFAARMLSVLCGVVSIWLVGTIASRCAVRPALAMLFTLGSYGFVYTSVIARGFALAEMLILAGVALLLGRQRLLAGVFFGAACCCNYLAVFVAAAVVVASGGWLAVVSAAPFLAVDAWFFAAQHAARAGQFPPFEIWPSVVRLVGYQTAAVFGGLPLYVDGIARLVLGVGVGLCAVWLLIGIGRSRPLCGDRAVWVLLGAAVATPVGLLLLGAAFDNTPIELRYLSFGLPFVGILGAGGLFPSCRVASQRRGPRSGYGLAGLIFHNPSSPLVQPAESGRIPGSRPGMTGSERRSTLAIVLVLTIQLASIAGLLLSPRTMQPARAAATDAARLAGDGVVLLPRGNDGVGIAGAFGIEAPPSLSLLLVGPNDAIMSGIGGHRRVVLVLLAQDRDSTAAVAMMRAAFAHPNWRRVAIGSNVEIYERTEKQE